MIEAKGFALLERTAVRRNVPGFDWRRFLAPWPRHRLGMPLSDARVGLVSTCGVRVADQPSFEVVSDEGDPSYRSDPGGHTYPPAALQPRRIRRPQCLCRP